MLSGLFRIIRESVLLWLKLPIEMEDYNLRGTLLICVEQQIIELKKGVVEEYLFTRTLQDF